MTFLKKYRYGAISFTFFLIVFTIQWAVLVVGFFEKAVEGHFDEKIHVNFFILIHGLFCSATILISLGAVIGKVSPFQLLWMAFFETILFGLNIYFQLYFGTVDIGGSMNIHTCKCIAIISRVIDIHLTPFCSGRVLWIDSDADCQQQTLAPQR